MTGHSDTSPIGEAFFNSFYGFTVLQGESGGVFLVEYSERVKFREHQLNTLQLEDRRVLKEILFDVCPDCGSKRFRFDRKNYYIYCQGCGVVLSALYPYSAGLRLYLPWGML